MFFSKKLICFFSVPIILKIRIRMAQPQTIANKKFRAFEYDIHDETYARSLSKMFTNHDKNVQTQFNLFTDNLMADNQINRFCLLNAIDDYQKTEDGRKYPLNSIFKDNAFNFRPYQAW